MIWTSFWVITMRKQITSFLCFLRTLEPFVQSVQMKPVLLAHPLHVPVTKTVSPHHLPNWSINTISYALKITV